MCTIEGIGDEVVQFFSTVFIVLILVATWKSTGVRRASRNNTAGSIVGLLILNSRLRSDRLGDSPIQAEVILPASSERIVDAEESDAEEEVHCIISESDDNAQAGSESNLLQEWVCEDCRATMNVAVNAGEPENYRGVLEESLPVGTDEVYSESTREQHLMQVNAEKQGAVKESRDKDVHCSYNNSPPINCPSGSNDQIRIKVKYLNDDQKQVVGWLQESLGVFKRRVFSAELSTGNTVRLVFGGKVLAQDQISLGSCGLFDDCVIHCLVHHQRSSATHAASLPAASRHWDLSTPLYVFLTLLLVLAWFCRFQNAHWFSHGATASLFGLTGAFALYMYSIFLPDEEDIPR